MATHPNLILYDATCGFCDLSVQWLLRHDTHRKLSFAPLNGPTAAAVRQRHPRMPLDLDSLVLVELSSKGRERVYWYSRAVIGISRHLPWPWRFGAALVVVPGFLRDLGYRAFAHIRYRVFGRVDTCRIPTPDERARFLP